MRFLVFPHGDATLMGALKYALKINIDLAENVVIRETQRKVRIYRDGCFDEYEIKNVVELGADKFYILGKLLSHQKPDYSEPVKNNLKEVLPC